MTRVVERSDEEDLGDLEELAGGRNYFTLENGKQVLATQYLGYQWLRHTRALYDVEPIAEPPFMTVAPHYHQLKAAAQAHWLCESRFKGILLGDGMGVGKTLTAILHSGFWKEIGLPIRRLILDEVHVVNKRGGVRHRAVKALFYKAVIQLSGTLAHNKWHNFSGDIDFLSGHPFPTHKDFMRAFTTYGPTWKTDHPDAFATSILQRFLQAVTIARPSQILQLKNCQAYNVTFSSELVELQAEIEELIRKFQMGGDEGQPNILEIDAQLFSIHPFLIDENGGADTDVGVDEDEDNQFQDADYQDDESDEEDVGGQDDESHENNEGYQDRASENGDMGDKDQKNKDQDLDEGEAKDQHESTTFSTAPDKEKREEWLERVRALKNIYHGSNRLRLFICAYESMRRDNPDRKIVVFSQYLRFLDIAAEARKRETGVEALRYDGTIPIHQRPIVQCNFESADPEVPLFLTTGAGGVGLSITCASIIVQTEIWWNRNVEAQAVCRVWRQGQETEVIWLRLFAADSPIDNYILKVQMQKAAVNSIIMEPLYRLPDQGPDIRDIRTIVPIPYLDDTIECEEEPDGPGGM